MKLIDLLKEVAIKYDAWQYPSMDQLRTEYKVEHEKKGRNIWPTEEEFIAAINDSPAVTVTRSMDSRIENRSRTASREELLDLIKGYASYPKYRNAGTLKALYGRFSKNQPMDMPIVLDHGRGKYEVFAGNTRMDIAFQLGIQPKVIMVKV